MDLDLATVDGLQAADEATLDDLARAVQTLADDKAWDEPSACNFDYIASAWLDEALARGRRDAAGLDQLDRLFLRASESLPFALPVATEMRHRWKAFRDLIESRRIGIETNSPEEALQRPHRQKAYDAIESGVADQKQLLKRLGLSEGYVSVIVKDLAQAGMIEVNKQGRSNSLYVSSGIDSLARQDTSKLSPRAPKPKLTTAAVEPESLSAQIFSIRQAA